MIRFAHLRTQNIDFVVFDADATTHSNQDRSRLLEQLTKSARASGLRVQKSALAFAENGELRFFGTSDLVEFLVHNPFFQWTHTITV